MRGADRLPEEELAESIPHGEPIEIAQRQVRSTGNGLSKVGCGHGLIGNCLWETGRHYRCVAIFLPAFAYRSKDNGGLFERMFAVVIIMIALGLATCGMDDPVVSGPAVFDFQFEVASTSADLSAETVTVDSVSWRPLRFRLTPSDQLEIDGDYEIHFCNHSDRQLMLRYDLRFLDHYGIFVDSFIPFGLPRELIAAASTVEAGEFQVESVDLRHPDELGIMVIAASIAIADSAR